MENCAWFVFLSCCCCFFFTNKDRHPCAYQEENQCKITCAWQLIRSLSAWMLLEANDMGNDILHLISTISQVFYKGLSIKLPFLASQLGCIIFMANALIDYRSQWTNGHAIILSVIVNISSLWLQLILHFSLFATSIFHWPVSVVVQENVDCHQVM